MTTVEAVRPTGRLAGVGGLLAGNVGARLGALGSLAIATAMVAWEGGASLVGQFTLHQRMLPGVFGILASSGLMSAIPYFLGRAEYPRHRARSTVGLMTVLGSLSAGSLWLLLTPLWYFLWFRSVGVGMVLLCAIPAATQIYVANTKAMLQGDGDIKAANAALFFEEFAFLPIYGVIVLFDLGNVGTLIGLVAADVVVAGGSAVRLARRGFFRGWGRPSRQMGREVAGYGARAEIGGFFHLLNSRMDSMILGALLGPAVVGVYTMAAKVAELLRVIGLTGPHVLYPIFAKEGPAAARSKTLKLLGPALGINLLLGVVLALAAPLIPVIFGDEFQAAVVVCWILLVGLAFEGVTGLITGYFMGINRPGLTSISLGVGLVVVFAMQMLLTPKFGVNGAALATGIGYFVTTSVLAVFFVRVKNVRVTNTAAQVDKGVN